MDTFYDDNRQSPRKRGIVLIFILITIIALCCTFQFTTDILSFRKFTLYKAQNVKNVQNLCTEKNGHLHYTYYNGDEIHKGINFQNVTCKTLASLYLVPNSVFDLNMENVLDIVFVTANSADHFHESRDTIASIQHHFPSHEIFYYDLGLKPHQVYEARHWKQVTYRKFNFHKYPEHVRRLKRYAWKLLIMGEVLHDHYGAFWMDSSIRMTSSDLSSVFRHVVQSAGALMFHDGHASVFTVTHPQMLTYLPTDTDQMKTTDMKGSGAFLLYNTNTTFHRVLLPMYACALEWNCIAPTDQLKCDVALVTVRDEYAGCHRYEQSILAITILNKCDFNTTCYSHPDDFYVIQRRPTHMYKIQYEEGFQHVKTAAEFRQLLRSNSH